MRPGRSIRTSRTRPALLPRRPWKPSRIQGLDNWYVTGHLRDRQKKRRWLSGNLLSLLQVLNLYRSSHQSPIPGIGFLPAWLWICRTNVFCIRKDSIDLLASATPNNLALRHGNWTFERTEEFAERTIKLKGTIHLRRPSSSIFAQKQTHHLVWRSGYSKKRRRAQRRELLHDVHPHENLWNPAMC